MNSESAIIIIFVNFDDKVNLPYIAPQSMRVSKKNGPSYCIWFCAGMSIALVPWEIGW